MRMLVYFFIILIVLILLVLLLMQAKLVLIITNEIVVIKIGGFKIYKLTYKSKKIKNLTGKIRDWFLKANVVKMPDKDKSKLHLIPGAVKKTKIIYKIKKNITIDKIHMKLDLGLDDAALTAKAVGMLWSAAGIFQSFICSNFTVKDITFNIKPLFSEIKVISEVYLKINIRVIHIILILLDIIKIKGVVENAGKRST